MDTPLVVTLCVSALACYLVCGIPFGLIVASRMAGVDVRHVGSGNIGMTNVARSAGGTAAAITFALDVGKGVLCMLVGRFLLTAFGGQAPESLAVGAPLDWAPVVLFCACVFGHIFSPYLRFHGGKGISVGFGAGLGLFWPVGLGMLAVFLAFAVPTRYVSAGSCAAAISMPIQCVLWHMGVPGIVLVSVASCVVLWSHRENIVRLLRHEERPFTIGRS